MVAGDGIEPPPPAFQGPLPMGLGAGAGGMGTGSEVKADVGSPAPSTRFASGAFVPAYRIYLGAVADA
jgi:hypothetical protein